METFTDPGRRGVVKMKGTENKQFVWTKNKGAASQTSCQTNRLKRTMSDARLFEAVFFF